jgi:tRNA modification GTPase
MRDTIFARATPPGRSGVAIIRLSGPSAPEAVSRLAGRLPPPRMAGLRRLRDPASGETIDEALVLIFPGPGSFTGETVAEIQCHGSMAVLRRIEGLLAAAPGLRPAEPGEFTRRALENGRLDLTQVEGLADLLNAETEAQLRQARFNAEGGMRAMAASWRDRVINALARIEAVIDFVDEGLDDTLLEPAAAEVRQLCDETECALAGSQAAERIREGFRVAICGVPNVGKSTLLNRIAGREAAITSHHPGTTRDSVEIHVEIGGLPVTFIDTAGLRDAADPVERIGIDRAGDIIRSSDLRIHLVERAKDADATHVQEGDIVALCKADLRPGATDGLAVSGLSGEGVDRLLDRVREVLSRRAATASAIANDRQRHAVGAFRSSLRAALCALPPEVGQPEIAAHHLAEALHALDSLTGRVDVERVLDSIFRNFCIGK